MTDCAFTATGELLVAYGAVSCQIVSEFSGPAANYHAAWNLVQVTSEPWVIFLPRQHQRAFAVHLSQLLRRVVGLNADRRVCVNVTVRISCADLHALFAATGMLYPDIVVYMLVTWCGGGGFFSVFKTNGTKN